MNVLSQLLAGAPTTSPITIGAIKQNLADLDKAVEALLVRLQDLTEKLEPVLGSDFPVDPCSEPPRISTCELGAMLSSTTARLNSIAAGITHLTARCEL